MRRLGLVLLSLFLLTTATAAATEKRFEPLRVFVSILPQAYFVERIGGEFVTVDVMVKPGQSPATYSPGARQIATLARSDVYFSIGVPFEHAFMDKVTAILGHDSVVDTRKGITLRRMKGHHHHEGENGVDPIGHDADKTREVTQGHATEDRKALAHDGHDGHDDEQAGNPGAHGEAPEEIAEGMDPHTWLSPPLAKRQAETIRDALVALRPEGKKRFDAGYAALAADLDQLHNHIEKVLARLQTRNLFVFHPSYGYFADTYGLNQIAVEVEGKSPDARSISRFVELARKSGVKVVFVQPQFSNRSARAIAGAIGGAVVTLDPLARDYIANLSQMADKVEKALED